MKDVEINELNEYQTRTNIICIIFGVAFWFLLFFVYQNLLIVLMKNIV